MKLSYQITGTLLSNSLRRALIAQASQTALQRSGSPRSAKPPLRKRHRSTGRREAGS